MRYPNHFPNWGGLEGANACVRRIERSFFRYASAEAIELITVDSPRKRTPPKKNEAVAEIVNNMSADLVIDFTVIVDGDIYPVEITRTDETQAADNVTDDPGFSVAPPIPAQDVDVDAQPEEEQGAEGPDPRHAIREGFVAQLQDYVGVLAQGEMSVGSDRLTFCVACGSDLHTLSNCTENAATRDLVLRGVQIIKESLLRYPRRVPPQEAEPMDVDTTDHVSVASSDRRPKAKARPRRGGEAVRGDVVLIRYENKHNLCTDVENRRGLHDACGVPLQESGPENSQRVVDLIEQLSDHRDRRLPQRGDRPSYVYDENTNSYTNPGYESIGGGRPIRCGILDLIPTKGASFINNRWDIVNEVVLRNITRQRRLNADWALSCIQSDLRHRIARRPGSEWLDNRCQVAFSSVIRCDEGGWVLIEDLVRHEPLWTHESRRITEGVSRTDDQQKKRVYNERLQLLFQGNMIAATKRNKAKIRLQFLGVRVKDPGTEVLGSAGSNMLVSVQDQITEIQNNDHCRHGQRYLNMCNGWVKPWAVRATSGHSAHSDPQNNLLQLDKNRFAISPSMTLLQRLGGAFHATACRNLDSIVTQGIMPGSEDPDGDFDHRENTVRHHYMDKGIKFVIKNWRPEDLRRDEDGRRMRVCPACYNIVPACFSRCTSCWSQFVSSGYYQGSPQRETPTEIPSDFIAQTMEAAAAAVPEAPEEEQEAMEVETVAEPEEIPEPSVIAEDDPEQEPDEEMDIEPGEDFDDAVPDAVAQERRPVFITGQSLNIDPELQLARTAMQPSYYSGKRNAHCIDANMTALSYMAY
ncbi:unnamed protein product, partial [Symbiodinium microadriaticum]